jgi:hypothetical protein
MDENFKDVDGENIDPRLVQIGQAQHMIDSISQKHQILANSSSRQRSKSLVVPNTLANVKNEPFNEPAANSQVTQNKRVRKPPSKHPSALVENFPPPEATPIVPIPPANPPNVNISLPKKDETVILAKKEKLAKVFYALIS